MGKCLLSGFLTPGKDVMALLPEMRDNVLYVRSVGDQTVDEGLRQMDEGMLAANKYFEETNLKVGLFFDLRESQENQRKS